MIVSAERLDVVFVRRLLPSVRHPLVQSVMILLRAFEDIHRVVTGPDVHVRVLYAFAGWRVGRCFWRFIIPHFMAYASSDASLGLCYPAIFKSAIRSLAGTGRPHFEGNFPMSMPLAKFAALPTIAALKLDAGMASTIPGLGHLPLIISSTSNLLASARPL